MIRAATNKRLKVILRHSKGATSQLPTHYTFMSSYTDMLIIQTSAMCKLIHVETLSKKNKIKNQFR